MKKFIEEFKAFALKGNVIDLSIGIIIGGAFSKIVSSFVNDILMPLFGLITGKVNFTYLRYVIESKSGTPELALKYGMFIQAIIDFVIIAFSIFIAVKLLNKIKKKEDEKPIEKPKQEALLEEIRDLLKEKA